MMFGYSGVLEEQIDPSTGLPIRQGPLRSHGNLVFVMHARRSSGGAGVDTATSILTGFPASDNRVAVTYALE